MKKLSICIPTYNRCVKLNELLVQIFNQIDESNLFDDVEIIVSDNNSVDNTKNVVSPYINKGLIYYKNEINIGPDANFLHLFEMANAEYIWLPGDDDLHNIDTISYILKMIKQYNFDYLYLRTSGADVKENRQAKLISNIELLRRTTIFTSFMTSQVIRSDLIKKNLNMAMKYLGGYMAYYSIFLNSLHSSKLCLISECREIFAASPENTGGYKFYSVWAVSAIQVFMESEFGNNKKIANQFRKDMLLDLILPIAFRTSGLKRGYTFESEDPKIALMKNYGSVGDQFLWRPYLMLPKIALLPIHIAIKIISKIRKFLNSSVS